MKRVCKGFMKDLKSKQGMEFVQSAIEWLFFNVLLCDVTVLSHLYFMDLFSSLD